MLRPTSASALPSLRSLRNWNLGICNQLQGVSWLQSLVQAEISRSLPQLSDVGSSERLSLREFSACRPQPPEVHVRDQSARGYSCSCSSLQAALLKPTAPAQPGTVTPYSHHVLIRLPPPPDQDLRKKEVWWPPIIEKHPAIVQAFTAVAEARGAIEGVVKVTAYEGMDVPGKLEENKADLMIFPSGVRYRNLAQDRIRDAVRHHVVEAAGDADELPPLNFSKAKQEEVNGLAIFVCTHGSRDTRCGVLGRAVALELQAQIEEQGLNLVKVYQTSHVGGHKFAGNILVYGGISPCDGDWFGGVDETNAAEFLNALVKVEVGQNGGLESPQLRKWWRGRMGLSKEEQIEEFQGVTGIPSAGSEEEGTESDLEPLPESPTSGSGEDAVSDNSTSESGSGSESSSESSQSDVGDETPR